MVGVAVKVTFVPAQMVVVPEMLTEGVNNGLTTIVNLLEVAIVGLAQVAFEVNIQVIESLFVNVLSLYVSLSVPTLLPFFLHW